MTEHQNNADHIKVLVFKRVRDPEIKTSLREAIRRFENSEWHAGYWGLFVATDKLTTDVLAGRLTLSIVQYNGFGSEMADRLNAYCDAIDSDLAGLQSLKEHLQ